MSAVLQPLRADSSTTRLSRSVLMLTWYVLTLTSWGINKLICFDLNPWRLTGYTLQHLGDYHCSFGLWTMWSWGMMLGLALSVHNWGWTPWYLYHGVNTLEALPSPYIMSANQRSRRSVTWGPANGRMFSILKVCRGQEQTSSHLKNPVCTLAWVHELGVQGDACCIVYFPISYQFASLYLCKRSFSCESNGLKSSPLVCLPHVRPV